jgi:6-phosphogluconolactonase (cycloisomerase 2 family)
VNSYDSSLSAFIVDAHSGQLRYNGHVPTGKFPSSVLVHPSGKYIYVAQQTGMKVAGFAVDAISGRLAALPGSPFDPKVVSPFWMVTDPAGKYLYLAGRNSKNIGAMTINAQTGALTVIKGSPFPGGELPRSVAMAPSGQFVYMANINDDNVSGYRIDPENGALTNIPGSPFAAGDAPQFMAIHPNGKFAFLSTWNSRSILTYRVDEKTGALQRQSELHMAAKVYPFGVSIDSTGRHLYVMDWFGSVLGYTVDADSGALAPIPGSPFPVKGKLATNLTLDPTGQFAFAPNYDSHDITTYTVDSTTGALTAGETSWSRGGPRTMVVVMGEKPVELQPQSVYVANAADNTLTAYRVDPTNGGLQSVNTVATGTRPSALVTNSTGRFVYVANAGSNTISAYLADPATGVLKEIAGSPFKARNNPQSLALDYNDQFMYVANTAEHVMSVYALDVRTGVLRELTTADVPYLEFPRPSGVEPRSVVLHPTSRYAYVLDAFASKIIVYGYYPDGPLAVNLTPQNNSFDVAKNPVALAADPRGKFLYIAHGDINALGIYGLNVYTGEVKAVPGSPFPAGTAPTAVAAHPGGQFVYVANKGSSDITVYHTDTAQSRFTRVGQVKTGAAPVAISVEGSGRFAYVANEGSNAISMFVIDATSGMLKPAGTIPTGAKPSALTVFTTIR